MVSISKEASITMATESITIHTLAGAVEILASMVRRTTSTYCHMDQEAVRDRPLESAKMASIGVQALLSLRGRHRFTGTGLTGPAQDPEMGKPLAVKAPSIF
ncbi:hypothetical protein TELCIR_08503 [Teladorsagia circumcincta]|uniref:Uncharacterized protein n=1 Tax=Teladorsagia circumcincta TaxID=45464 RepID=A0A2G9UIV6_TELCI|nr:hypothetical protein TELCIR_08503 [Teladorsagia circumcincta]